MIFYVFSATSVQLCHSQRSRLRVNHLGFPPFFIYKDGPIASARGVDVDLINVVKDKLGIKNLQNRHEANFSVTFRKVPKSQKMQLALL